MRERTDRWKAWGIGIMLLLVAVALCVLSYNTGAKYGVEERDEEMVKLIAMTADFGEEQIGPFTASKMNGGLLMRYNYVTSSMISRSNIEKSRKAEAEKEANNKKEGKK